MAPPPITPNPHRFITSTPSTRPPEQQPSSSLRQDRTPQPASLIAKKFATTPRLTFSSSNSKSVGYANPHQQTLNVSSPFEARRHFPKPAPPQSETIDENSSGEGDTGEEFHPQPLNNSAISTTNLHQGEPLSPPLVSAKRRRLKAPEQEQIVISSSPAASPPSSPPLPVSPSPPITPPPSLHALSASAKYPRFRLPTHSSPPSTSTKPAFVLPPAPGSPPYAQVSSLVFSPQKRNQKFVHGGVAATVREWVVEASQPLYHSRHQSGEDWDFQFRVEEAKELQVWDDAGSLVQAQTSDGAKGGKKWMLVGKRDGERPRIGDMVGIRKPVWDVDIGEEGNREGWSVAVEWKLS